MIVLAGGSGTRFGTSTNKVYAEVDGRPLLEAALEAIAGVVESLVLVVRAGDETEAARLVDRRSIEVTTGGATRTESERAGLDVLRDRIGAGEIEWVGIHDGARPFVSASLIERVFEAARSVGGAVPGLAVDEQLYELVDGRLEQRPGPTPWAVQTPQVFAAGPLLAAYDAQPDADGLDTADIVGDRIAIAMVEGDPTNRKITYPADLPPTAL